MSPLPLPPEGALSDTPRGFWNQGVSAASKEVLGKNESNLERLGLRYGPLGLLTFFGDERRH